MIIDSVAVACSQEPHVPEPPPMLRHLQHSHLDLYSSVLKGRNKGMVDVICEVLVNATRDVVCGGRLAEGRLMLDQPI